MRNRGEKPGSRQPLSRFVHLYLLFVPSFTATLSLTTAHFATVDTGTALQQALQNGPPHVTVTAHLDLSDLERADCNRDGRLSAQDAVLCVRQTTKSIKGGCFSSPPPVRGPQLLPLRSGACVILATQHLFDVVEAPARTWIHNLYLRANRQMAANNNMALIHMDSDGAIPAGPHLWLSNVVFQGDGGHLRAISLASPGVSAFVVDSNFSDTMGSTGPVAYINSGSAKFQRCEFREFHDTADQGAVVLVNAGSNAAFVGCVFEEMTDTTPACRVHAAATVYSDDNSLPVMDKEMGQLVPPAQLADASPGRFLSTDDQVLLEIQQESQQQWQDLSGGRGNGAMQAVIISCVVAACVLVCIALAAFWYWWRLGRVSLAESSLAPKQTDRSYMDCGMSPVASVLNNAAWLQSAGVDIHSSLQDDCSPLPVHSATVSSMPAPTSCPDSAGMRFTYSSVTAAPSLTQRTPPEDPRSAAESDLPDAKAAHVRESSRVSLRPQPSEASSCISSAMLPPRPWSQALADRGTEGLSPITMSRPESNVFVDRGTEGLSPLATARAFAGNGHDAISMGGSGFLSDNLPETNNVQPDVTESTSSMMSTPRKELKQILDEMHAHGERLLGSYEVLGPAERREGGQAVVQFLSRLQSPHRCAAKFFFKLEHFEREKTFYESTGVCRQMMPQMLSIEANSGGAVRSSSGYSFPPFIVMERGVGLDEWASSHPAGFTTTVHALCCIARRLSLLHQHGWAHRDLKPGNILSLGESTKWHLIDFGSAAPIGHEAGLTFSWQYAAPESLLSYERGKDTIVVDAAVDVWALGVIAFEMLTGVRCFKGFMLKHPDVCDRVLGRKPLPWEGSGDAARKHRAALKGMKSSVLMCLDRDPSSRPSVQELVATWDTVCHTG